MINLDGKKLILASGSPRRAHILKLLGLDFEVVRSAVNEDEESYTIPEVQVLELAKKKAMDVADKVDGGLIVGADTIVVLGNTVLEKPTDEADAKTMLRKLSGNTHTVYTGVALIDTVTDEIFSDYEKTNVTFRDLSDAEIESYVNEDKPLDKAGAYGIQDRGAVFVTGIEGCFYNVMGFPVSRFYQILTSFLERTASDTS